MCFIKYNNNIDTLSGINVQLNYKGFEP